MDASPDILADTVRARRLAVDKDFELLRVRLRNADPRRRIDPRRWIRTAAPVAAPVAAGAAALWLLARRRRRLDSLDALLLHGLDDLYHIEKQTLAALDRMSAAASNPELRNALQHHQLETDGHLERLGRVFRSLRARPARGSSAAVAALVADGQRLSKKHADPNVRDAWLIASAQRLEHLEMANYGTLRTFAETLGYTYAAHLLQQTLEEERTMDEKLSRLAERFVNPQSIRAARPA